MFEDNGWRYVPVVKSCNAPELWNPYSETAQTKVIKHYNLIMNIDLLKPGAAMNLRTKSHCKSFYYDG